MIIHNQREGKKYPLLVPYRAFDKLKGNLSYTNRLVMDVSWKCMMNNLVCIPSHKKTTLLWPSHLEHERQLKWENSGDNCRRKMAKIC